MKTLEDEVFFVKLTQAFGKDDQEEHLMRWM